MGMAAPVDEASLAPRTSLAPADPPSQRLEIVPAAARDAWRDPWIAVAVHLAAGLVYALAMSLAWAWLADAGDAWDVILLLTLFFAWPLVVIVVGIVAMSWRGMLAVRGCGQSGIASLPSSRRGG
jgi:hypothetical protein